MDIKLGQKVRVRATIYPEIKRTSGSYYGNKVRRYMRTERSGPIFGYVSGKRNLREGYTTIDEDGANFKPTNIFQAYLVAVGWGQMEKVLPEDIEVIASCEEDNHVQ